MNIRTGGGVLASPIVKAVLDALGVSYVVEQGQDESGTWYRRFSNGWLEQGGVMAITSTEGTVNFPIEFSSTEYSLIAFLKDGELGGKLYLWLFNPSTTSCGVKMGSDGRPSISTASWEAKGFAA